MTKKHSTTTMKAPTASLDPIVDWYVNNYRSTYFPSSCGPSHSTLLSKPSDKEKAEELLNDPHMWALKSWMKATVYLPLMADVIKIKPWLSVSRFKDFEDLYAWVYSWMKRPYVGQLYIYDVALRLAMLDSSGSLMPSKYVYLHARPMKGYKELFNRGYFTYPVKGQEAVIPRTAFDPPFAKLKAYEIEDLLCYIAKSLDRIASKKTATKEPHASLDLLVAKI